MFRMWIKTIVLIVCMVAALAADSKKKDDARGKRNLQYNIAHHFNGPYRLERRISTGPQIPLYHSQYFPGPLRSYTPFHKGRPHSLPPPPYAVQMEPLVHYSQRDPLYDINSLSLNADGQDDLLTDNNHLSEHVYGPQPQKHIVERPVYIKEPEPIIEIIIKESNVTLPPPPAPPTPPPKKKEQVQVFYVKYKKNPNGHGKDSIIYDKPVPAISPQIEDEHEEIPPETHHHHEVVTSPPPPSTTLRTVIHPDSETYHSPSGIKVTFGKEGFDYHKRSNKPEDLKASPGDQRSVQFPQGRQLSSFPSSSPRRPPPSYTFDSSPSTYRQPQPYRPFTQFRQPPFSRPTPQEYSTLPKFPEFSQPPKNNQNFPPPRPVPPQFNRQPVPYQPFESLRQQPPQFRPETRFPITQSPPITQKPLIFNQKAHFNEPRPKPQPQEKPVPQFQQAQVPGYHTIRQDRIPHQQQPSIPKQQEFEQRPTIPQNHPAHQQPEIQQFQQAQVQHQQQFQQQPSHHQQQQPQAHQQQFKQQPSHHQQQFQQQPSHHQQQQPQSHQQQFQQQPSHHQQQQPQSHQQQFQQQSQSHQQQFQHHQQQFQQQQFNQPPSIIPPGGELIQSVPKYEQHISVEEPAKKPNQSGFQTNQYNIQPQLQQSSIQLSSSINYNNKHEQSQSQSNTPVQQQLREANALQDSIRQSSPQFFNFQQAQNLNYYQTTFKPPSTFHTSPRTSTYSSTTTTTTTTTQKPTTTTKDPKILNAQLPDEVPDDLRQQLLSSGILNNAQISILDYDKVGDIPLSALPPDQLSNFFSAGGAQQIASGSEPIPAIAEPKNFDTAASEIHEVKVKPEVEMKVVRYDPESENGQQVQKSYVEQDATQLEPVVLNDEKYNRYLPLKVSGAQFPIPEVPELKGKKISSVVVLAPVAYDFSSSRKTREVKDEEVELVEDLTLKELIKNPSRENFQKFLEKENKTKSDQQSVILLVTGSDSDSKDKEIFMYDVSTRSVSKLDGELSSAFVDAAEANSFDDTKASASEIVETRIPYNVPIIDPEGDLETEASEHLESFVDISGMPVEEDLATSETKFEDH